MLMLALRPRHCMSKLPRYWRLGWVGHWVDYQELRGPWIRVGAEPEDMQHAGGSRLLYSCTGVSGILHPAPAPVLPASMCRPGCRVSKSVAMRMIIAAQLATLYGHEQECVCVSRISPCHAPQVKIEKSHRRLK